MRGFHDCVELVVRVPVAVHDANAFATTGSPQEGLCRYVCLYGGERLYSEDDVRRFENIRGKLERQETSEFQPLSQSFQIVYPVFPGTSSTGFRVPSPESLVTCSSTLVCVFR